MISSMPLETCWAFNERWNNKFWYKVASCWLFLLSHTAMHGSMNIKKKNKSTNLSSGDILISAWWFESILPPCLHSGFGGLVVSVLASGTQDRGFEPGRKIPQNAFLQRGSKAVCPMSQICGMLKTPGNYVEVEFSGEICRLFLAHFRSSLPEGSHVAWRGAPLGLTGGTKGGAQRAW